MTAAGSSLDLAGVLLPVTTPFDARTGELDLPAFRENAGHWVARGVNGLVVAGTTGEALLLDEEERVTLVRAARELVPPDVLLTAGTGVESTRATVRLSLAVADAGADAVLVQPPAYYKGAMTPEALREHYVAVAEASPVPVIIYQAPLRMSTLDLPNGLIVELSHHPNIVGVKDSRGSLDLVGDLVEHADEGFQVLVGSGAHLYAGLEVGAVGGIVAVGDFAPELAVRLYEAFRAGRTSEAGRLQQRLGPLHNEIVAGLGVPGVKAALDLVGLAGGDPRRPLQPLPPSRRDAVRTALVRGGLLED